MRETDERDRQQDGEAAQEQERETASVMKLLPIDDLILLGEINELPRHRRRLIRAMILD